MILALVTLAVPFAGSEASSRSGKTRLTDPSSTSSVAVIQDSSRQIAYGGQWSTANQGDYLGGGVKYTNASNARAALKFTGAEISWIGPVGPTRGMARVYVDGEFASTVSSWAPAFEATRILFRKSWDAVSAHRITIVASGTPSHPTVAVDAFFVRTTTASAGVPVDDNGAPIVAIASVEAAASPASSSGTLTPTFTPTLTPTTAPTLVPTAVPTLTPTTAPTLVPTAAPTLTPTTAPTAVPTSTPRVTPAPTPTPTPRPTATPTATQTPTAASSTVRVTSIPALLSALADNAVTEIVVANGTYRVSAAGLQRSDSLWIGARFSGRTRAVTVRAETRGGVTFDGGGTSYFGGLSFEEGAHDQTWDGFRFANGQATETGIITYGGYAGRVAPHHITLRHITILASCTGRATTISSPTTDHAIYVAHAVGGPHDLLFEDISVDGRGGLASAIHFYHHDSTNRNAWNVTVRRLTVNRTQQAIILWDSTLRNITIDGATITNALDNAVRYEQPGSNILLRNITSTGSGSGSGFYSSQGANPPGVTFSGNSFN